MHDTGNSNSSLDTLFKASDYLHFHDLIYPPERRDVEVGFLINALKLTRSMAILDMGCGHGRHANMLAAHVREVVGIDRSDEFLARAKEEANRLCLTNVAYHAGDIREVEFPRRFGAAILASTIFGLFTDEENIRILVNLRNSLRRGGRLFFDVINRDTVLVDFKPDAVTEHNGSYLLDRLAFDPAAGRMTNRRVYLRDGVVTEATFSLRLYNLSDIMSLLASASTLR